MLLNTLTMVGPPDDEKCFRICLLITMQCTNVTDGRTDKRTPHDACRTAKIRDLIQTQLKQYYLAYTWRVVIAERKHVP